MIRISPVIASCTSRRRRTAKVLKTQLNALAAELSQSQPNKNMKPKSFVIAVAAFCSAVSLIAAEKIVGGPKGGRLLEVDGQKAEFFVTTDRKVEITFYDDALKPVAPSEQVVAVTAEPKAGRAKLDLDKTATGYLSKTALPEGDPYRVVVQLRSKPDAKPQNFRIDLELHTCSECKRKEYACTCVEG
jgi:hypothetical protein